MMNSLETCEDGILIGLYAAYIPGLGVDSEAFLLS